MAKNDASSNTTSLGDSLHDVIPTALRTGCSIGRDWLSLTSE